MQKAWEETDRHKERANVMCLENARLLQMLTSRDKEEEYLASCRVVEAQAAKLE